MNDTNTRDKILNLIDRVEALSAKMEAENAKSSQEWDNICQLIVETGKCQIPYLMK